MARRGIAWSALCCLLVGVSLQAGPIREVYVDGEPLKKVSPQRLRGVDVEIRADGTLYIQTPTVPAAAPVPAPTPTPVVEDTRPLEERYWLAVQDRGSLTSWSLDVELNGNKVGAFSAGEPRVVEVTSFFKRGANRAVVSSRHTSSDASRAPLDGSLVLVLAPGKVDASQDAISLSYPIFTLERPGAAAEILPETLQFTLPPPVRP